MARSSERFFHRTLLPAEHVARCTHASGYYDRLPYAPVFLRHLLPAFRESPGSALPVHVDGRPFAFHDVLLALGYVMGDVVEQLHSKLVRALSEDLLEAPPHIVHY